MRTWATADGSAGARRRDRQRLPGDDGFGPEVVRHLAAGPPLPDDVRVVDYGIRGMHLAYDLLDGYDALVLIDALPGPRPARRGGRAGDRARRT